MKISTDHCFYCDRGMKLSTHHSFYCDRGIPFITIVEWNYQRTPIFITIIESNYYILFLVRCGTVRYGARRYNTIRYNTIRCEQSTTPTWNTVNNDAIMIRYDTIIWYNNTIRYKQHTSFDGSTGWLNNTVINVVVITVDQPLSYHQSPVTLPLPAPMALACASYQTN